MTTDPPDLSRSYAVSINDTGDAYDEPVALGEGHEAAFPTSNIQQRLGLLTPA